MQHSFANMKAVTLMMTLTMTIQESLGSSIKAENSQRSCFIREFFGIFAEEKILWSETAKDVRELKKDVKRIEENLPIWKNCKYRPAFFAKLSKSAHLSVGQKVKYDNVVTDTCNTYDKSTGIFTCPSSGVYAFHYASLSDTKTTCYLLLFKNGKKIVDAYADDSGSYESLGNSVVLLLQEGDNVYVAMGNDGKPGTAYERYSTFSGYAL